MRFLGCLDRGPAFWGGRGHGPKFAGAGDVVEERAELFTFRRVEPEPPAARGFDAGFSGARLGGACPRGSSCGFAR